MWGIEGSPVNSPQRPVTRGFDVFFDLRLNKWLSKQSLGWWFETISRPLWRHHNEQCVLYIVPAVVWGGEIRHPCTVFLSLSEIVIKIQENAIENVVWKMWLSCLGLSVLRHFDTKHFRFKRDGEIRPHTQPRTQVLFAIYIYFIFQHIVHSKTLQYTWIKQSFAKPNLVYTLTVEVIQKLDGYQGSLRLSCWSPIRKNKRSIDITITAWQFQCNRNTK